MNERTVVPVRAGVRPLRVSLAAGVVGAFGFLGIWLYAPPGQQVDSLWSYAIKLAAFLALTIFVAFFPQRPPALYLLLIVAFVAFAGFFMPRAGWFYFMDTERARGDDFYTHMYLLTYPAIAMSISGAYRLGGGTPGRTLKLAWSSVVVLFSGFLDLMFQVINPGPADPISAPHIVLITGRPLSFDETIVFTLAHVPLLVVLLLLPLDRWIDRFVPGATAAPFRGDEG